MGTPGLFLFLLDSCVNLDSRTICMAVVLSTAQLLVQTLTTVLQELPSPLLRYLDRQREGTAQCRVQLVQCRGNNLTVGLPAGAGPAAPPDRLTELLLSCSTCQCQLLFLCCLVISMMSSSTQLLCFSISSVGRLAAAALCGPVSIGACRLRHGCDVSWVGTAVSFV